MARIGYTITCAVQNLKHPISPCVLHSICDPNQPSCTYSMGASLYVRTYIHAAHHKRGFTLIKRNEINALHTHMEIWKHPSMLLMPNYEDAPQKCLCA